MPVEGFDAGEWIRQGHHRDCRVHDPYCEDCQHPRCQHRQATHGRGHPHRGEPAGFRCHSILSTDGDMCWCAEFIPERDLELALDKNSPHGE